MTTDERPPVRPRSAGAAGARRDIHEEALAGPDPQMVAAALRRLKAEFDANGDAIGKMLLEDEDVVPTPTGKISSRWFFNGYQQAMRDMAAKFEEGGEQAARQWIADNTA